MSKTAAPPAPRATVIVPASNEAGYIEACLRALLASDPAPPFETIVVANGCRDDTAARARALAAELATPARPLSVIETPRGGKPHALQLGDEAAGASIRIYLDADVVVSPRLIGDLIETLAASPEPRFASGRPRIMPARHPLSLLYARFWQGLPFFATGVPGCGLYAVNAAGRGRWCAWPEVISDDGFARLHFTPEERILVPVSYEWPMIEGLRALVRVRRRQDRGLRELAARFPELMRNADPPSRTLRAKLGCALRDPAGLVVYGAVLLLSRWPVRAAPGAWERGR